MRTAVVLATLLFGSSCESKASGPVERYLARGQITGMPAGTASKEIEIHHEAIPTFRNQQGKVTGMHSMPMPFEVTTATPLTGFAVGDKVSVSFEVRWDARSPLRVTALEKLPADTALTLE